MLINVNISEEELQKPYSHFLHKPQAVIPRELIDNIEKGPYPESDALLFENINDLLEPGYLQVETGYVNLSDGSVYAAMLTVLPSVTGEMIDWWFWWNPQDPLRYRIMYPQAHFGTGLDVDLETFKSRTGPYNQRIWDTTTFPVEDIGEGVDHLSMHFVSPERFGFDVSRFESAEVETVICGIAGSISKNLKQHTFMCHLVRKRENGVEVRSRCWIGHTLKINGIKEGSSLNNLINKRSVKKRIIPRDIGQKYCMHCAQEIRNLGEILPELYKTYA